MGILLMGGGLGWISSKSIFAIGFIITVIILGGLFFRELHGGRRGGGHTKKMMDYDTMAMSTVVADTNKANQRAQIVSTLANSSTDPSSTSNNIDQIIRRVINDQQAGGPLANLQKQRGQGQLTANDYRLRMINYINQLAAEHSIPVGTMQVINNRNLLAQT